MFLYHNDYWTKDLSNSITINKYVTAQISGQYFAVADNLFMFVIIQLPQDQCVVASVFGGYFATEKNICKSLGLR